MPPIYYLNQPPHPFWDFVAGIEDHPFFAQYRRPVPPTPPPQPPRPETAGPSEKANNDKVKGKRAETSNVEDPPEIDPSTLASEGKDVPFRGRGRFAKAFEEKDNNNNNNKDNAEEGDSSSSGRRGCHGGHHHRGPHHGHHNAWPGPPPFGPPPFGPPPFFFGPHGPFGAHHGPPGHEGGPEGHGPRAGFRGGRGGFCRGGRGGPPHHHHGHHGPHSRSPPRAGGPFPGGGRPGHQASSGGFDLSNFLSNLGERLGVDLTSAAQGLGLRSAPRSSAVETDFEPRTDIFDTAAAYVIHLSLPGAKKSDVGVDWDGEHSVVRVAGVVHRPNVDEEMMSRLVVDGRKRETGVFEKTIRLGTTKDPASVDVDGITAKMVDGVLIIRVPKVEKTFEKKEVHVSGGGGGSSSPSPAPSRPNNNDERAEGDAYMNEKEDLLFDAATTAANDDDDGEKEDRDMYDADPMAESEHRQQESKPAPAGDTTMGNDTAEAEAEAEAEAAAAKRKQREAKEEEALHDRDDRSETVGFDNEATTETLPRYEAEDTTNKAQRANADVDVANDEDNMSDWEKYGGSEDEGEYVKINVD